MKNKIQAILDELYPNPPIPLDHRDPFTLLIATLLSAQCQDRRVNMVTKNLFARASTPGEMAALPIEELEAIIRPCGLYHTKAKNIRALSKKLLEEFQGRVPNTFEDLESLPGVGHKTASVVMIHAFRREAFPVDTHIHRLAKRWGLSKGKTREQTERDLKRVFAKKDWEKLHLQMIYFGREYCTARGHDPQVCPICKHFLCCLEAP